jgi:hypothetical protein
MADIGRWFDAIAVYRQLGYATSNRLGYIRHLRLCAAAREMPQVEWTANMLETRVT